MFHRQGSICIHGSLYIYVVHILSSGRRWTHLHKLRHLSPCSLFKFMYSIWRGERMFLKIICLSIIDILYASVDKHAYESTTSPTKRDKSKSQPCLDRGSGYICMLWNKSLISHVEKMYSTHLTWRCIIVLTPFFLVEFCHFSKTSGRKLSENHSGNCFTDQASFSCHVTTLRVNFSWFLSGILNEYMTF